MLTSMRETSAYWQVANSTYMSLLLVDGSHSLPPEAKAFDDLAAMRIAWLSCSADRLYSFAVLTVESEMLVAHERQAFVCRHSGHGRPQAILRGRPIEGLCRRRKIERVLLCVLRIV